MNAIGLASRSVRIKGLVNTLLGLIHIVGTFTFESSKIAGQGTPHLRRDYLVWFWGVGVFILLSGILDLICVRAIRDGSNLAWRIALFSSVSIGLFGACGVSFYGISPPLVLLLTGALATACLAWTRKGFAKDGRLSGSAPSNPS